MTYSRAFDWACSQWQHVVDVWEGDMECFVKE